MGWKPHRLMAQGIITLRSATRGIADSFRVLGVIVSAKKLQDLLRDTMGIPDAMDKPSDLDRLISETLHKHVDLPEDVARGLSDATIAQDDLDLARYMGVEPLRLLILGLETIACATRDASRIKINPEWSDHRLKRLGIEFTLGKGIVWKNGILRVSSTQLPTTVLDAIKGRTLDSVFEHGWSGWEKLRIERAQQADGTFVLHTQPQQERKLLEI